MIDNMKEFKWQFLTIVLIIVGSLGLAYSTPLESVDSQEVIGASISPELHQKLKEGCEIDAYIKRGDSVCEIKIRIKDDFAEPMPYDDIEFERLIRVDVLKTSSQKKSADRVNDFTERDILAYKKYKNGSKMSEVFYYSTLTRRLRRLDLDSKILNLGVTYAEFFRALEELVVQDNSKLGKGNIHRTEIVFKEIIPDETFLLSPPRAMRY